MSKNDCLTCHGTGEVYPDCSCYEIIGGHQPGCSFHGMKPEQIAEMSGKSSPCPDCNRRDTRPSVWQDPNVIAAIREGRSMFGIALLSCPRCGQFGYYNQGSHFTCRHCEIGYYVATESEDISELEGRNVIVADVVYTMEDVTAAECADYP